jgi:hypothetical protein
LAAFELDYSDLPRTLGAWMAVRQAELMLAHLAASPTRWPENAIYCHSCLTAMRSVTLLLQKALRHDEGWSEWYPGVQARLAADPEFEFLKHARNFVLKEGALEILASHGFEMTNTPPGLEVRGMGPDGPDVWIPSPAGEGDMVPVDWRRLKGFRYNVDLSIAPQPGLPTPPARELKRMLADKIEVLDAIVREADERFPGEDWDDWDPELEAALDDEW